MATSYIDALARRQLAPLRYRRGRDRRRAVRCGLRPGERSPLFESTSAVVARDYGAHAVRFCYVHLGEEVCRLELPEWSASGPALELAHAGILAQADKGHGYPLAIQEAHEQAVVNGADRLYFAQLVEEMLAAEGLPTGTSQKSAASAPGSCRPHATVEWRAP